MRVHLVTTNPALCSVLADDLCEIDGVEARVVDVQLLGSDSIPGFDDVVIVAEAALRTWRRLRDDVRIDSDATRVVGSLGAFWALQRHPESLGFDGWVDFKWPTRQIASELTGIRSRRNALRNSNVLRIRPTPPDDGIHAELDAIERRIVAYVTMGLCDRDIAAKVHLSPQTVRNRVSRLLERFHLCNRTQLAMMCAQDSRIVMGRAMIPESAPLSVNIQ